MKKEDFKKGQTVFLLQVKDVSDLLLYERISPAEVVSVGGKFVTVDLDWHGLIKFEIDYFFRQATTRAPRFELYLTEEEIFEKYARRDLEDRADDAFCKGRRIVKRLTEDEINAIIEIIERYEE